MDDPPPPPVPGNTAAYQLIRGTLARLWSTDSDKDVRRLALAILAQVNAGAGADPAGAARTARTAIAAQMIGAARQGVDAGVWPGAHDIRVASDVILAGLDFALADVSSLELVMLLRTMATGRGEACGVESVP